MKTFFADSNSTLKEERKHPLAVKTVLSVLVVTAMAGTSLMACGTADSGKTEVVRSSLVPASVESSESEIQSKSMTGSSVTSIKANTSSLANTPVPEPTSDPETTVTPGDSGTQYKPHLYSSTKTTPSPGGSNPEGYDMENYSDGQDLYDDNEGDFEDEEEAEDYYDDYGE